MDPECNIESKLLQCTSNDFVNDDSYDYVHMAGKEQVRVVKILSDLNRWEPIGVIGMSLREVYPIILGNVNGEAFSHDRSSRSSFQRQKLLRSRGEKYWNERGTLDPYGIH